MIPLRDVIASEQNEPLPYLVFMASSPPSEVIGRLTQQPISHFRTLQINHNSPGRAKNIFNFIGILTKMLCQRSVPLLCPIRHRLKSLLNSSPKTASIAIIDSSSIHHHHHHHLKGGGRRDQREGGLRWASATNADGSVLLLPHLINSLDTIQ